MTLRTCGFSLLTKVRRAVRIGCKNTTFTQLSHTVEVWEWEKQRPVWVNGMKTLWKFGIFWVSGNFSSLLISLPVQNTPASVFCLQLQRHHRDNKYFRNNITGTSHILMVFLANAIESNHLIRQKTVKKEKSTSGFSFNLCFFTWLISLLLSMSLSVSTSLEEKRDQETRSCLQPINKCTRLYSHIHHMAPCSGRKTKSFYLFLKHTSDLIPIIYQNTHASVHLCYERCTSLSGVLYTSS